MKLRSILRPLLAVALLALAVWLLWSNPEPLRHLADVAPQTLAALAAITLLNQALIAARFALVVEHCAQAKVPATTWFRLTMVGNFLNLFVPQLGNVYRALVLKREHKVAYATYTTGLFAFVWLDLLTGVGVALVVIAVLDHGLQVAGVPALALLAGACVLLLVAPFVAGAMLRALHIEHAFAARMQARLSTLLATSTSVLRRPALLLAFTAINVSAAAIQVVALWLAFHAIGADVDGATMVMFQVLLKLSNQFVITPGNLGLTELAYAGLAHAAAQCTAEQGVAAALLLRMINLLISSVLGVSLGGLPMLLGARPNAAELDENDDDDDGSKTPDVTPSP
jgi:uncharacterized protein (TIRG00374 family)